VWNFRRELGDAFETFRWNVFDQTHVLNQRFSLLLLGLPVSITQFNRCLCRFQCVLSSVIPCNSLPLIRSISIICFRRALLSVIRDTFSCLSWRSLGDALRLQRTIHVSVAWLRTGQLTVWSHNESWRTTVHFSSRRFDADNRSALRLVSGCTLASASVLVVHATRARFNRSATAPLRTTPSEPAEWIIWTGTDLGFYKGGCPIYLKGAPMSSVKGAGGGSGKGTVPPPQKMFRFLSSKRRVLVHPWCYFLQLINLNWIGGRPLLVGGLGPHRPHPKSGRPSALPALPSR